MLCLLDLTQGGVDPRNFRRGPEIEGLFCRAPDLFRIRPIDDLEQLKFSDVRFRRGCEDIQANTRRGYLRKAIDLFVPESVRFS